MDQVDILSLDSSLPHLGFLVPVLTSGRGGRKWPNIGLSGWLGGWGLKTLFSHNPVAPLLSFSSNFLDATASLDLYHGGWMIPTIGLKRFGSTDSSGILSEIWIVIGISNCLGINLIN